jgi:hypothetical protein
LLRELHEKLQRGGLSGAKLARTLKDADGSREVVDPPSSPESSSQDGRGGDEIVGEAVV